MKNAYISLIKDYSFSKRVFDAPRWGAVTNTNDQIGRR